MGYTVVAITLADRRKFDQAVIDSGYLSRVRGSADVPFDEADIVKIEQTNETWDWNENPQASLRFSPVNCLCPTL